MVIQKKVKEVEDPEADVTNITNIGLLDDKSADDMSVINPGDITIEKSNQKPAPKGTNKVDEEEEDDFHLLKLEDKLERA